MARNGEGICGLTDIQNPDIPSFGKKGLQSLLGRRLRERKQAKQFITLVDRLQEWVPPERVTWVSQQTRAYYSAILDLAKKHDGRLNFNDLMIALAAKDAALQYIVSFDSDFDLIPWLTRLKSASDVRKLDS